MLNFTWLAIIAGALIAGVYLLETIGYYLRGAGERYGIASVGYSVHVQVATISRVGSLLALPLLGWMIDRGAQIKDILIAPIACGCVFLVFCTFFLRIRNIEKYVDKLFRFFVMHVSKLEINLDPLNQQVVVKKKSCIQQTSQILITGGASSLFAVGGVFLAFIFASTWSEYRATLLQLSPALTAVGTIISVTFFDPRVSVLIDNNYEQDVVFKSIVISRMFAMATIVILSTCFYIFT